MKIFPPVVTFSITSRCNNNCKYCFGPKNKKELNFSSLKKIFRLLSEKQAKAVVLSGGEPLVRSDFDQIIEELKGNGLSIFLDTNGDLFFKHKRVILNNVDIIGLPIDFPNRSYRNKQNIKTVLRVIDYLESQKKRPNIRVGTVITKDNYKILEKIGKLLDKRPIDVWKLYQFSPQAVNALKNKKTLEIAQKDFIKVAQKIKDKFEKKFKIVISSRENRNRAYFFINPDGTVLVPDDDLNICRKIKIGHIYDQDILAKWEKAVLKSNYFSNIKLTFNI